MSRPSLPSLPEDLVVDVVDPPPLARPLFDLRVALLLLVMAVGALLALYGVAQMAVWIFGGSR